MLIEERHRRIIEELSNDPDITVKRLSELLCFSEPTIRRDLTELHKKGIITKVYGGAILNKVSADGEIPFLVRENEKSDGKILMGKKAASYVYDGAVIMLDGSTSAYNIVPYLTKFKDIIVITSGAKTAVALAERGIANFCTGGKMLTNSYSYVGSDAEEFVKKFNADILFFSCHGLSNEGVMSDPAIAEANLRRVMAGQCKKKILLCDGSKIGKSFLYNMGDISSVDAVISDIELPVNITSKLNK